MGYSWSNGLQMSNLWCANCCWNTGHCNGKAKMVMEEEVQDRFLHIPRDDQAPDGFTFANAGSK
ncbi:hypothetical protein Patl1_02561 [Pistacia atlantica]|uniref:Uncharacterized protein n=1 Tax=Pistacia atlantica TaxID=434234 RepID=A0ACC1C6W7_9ROSI|nr:hypothetical protein Patl1_02561 [Pistacia atlantica]